jgi:hypothetical protein
MNAKHTIREEDRTVCPCCKSGNAESFDGEGTQCYDCGYYDNPIRNGYDAIVGTRKGISAVINPEFASLCATEPPRYCYG